MLRYLPWLVLLTGVALRAWRFLSIPYTYDEYSGLWRLGTGTYADMLRDGVMQDAHPPLYMVFLKAWTAVGGFSAPWVKLPFVLSGMAAVYLCYLVGKKWFSAGTGVLAAAMLAVVQEGIMHSQIARPYAFGLLFILLAALTLHPLCVKPGLRRALWFAFMLALCAYTHHFSMLAAAWMWVASFLLFVPARKYLLVAAALAMLLYAPNLYILRAQLAMGGIGTVLAPPDFDFFTQYAAYVFHFSWVFAACTGMALLLSRSNGASAHRRATGLFLITATGTLLTGTLYSHWVAPVMQPRVLFFVLPLWFLLLFNRAGATTGWKYALSALLILTSGSVSLICERQYYTQFYHDGFSGVLKASSADSASPPPVRVLAYSPDILRRQTLPSEGIINPDSLWNWCDYQTFADTVRCKALHFGWTTQYYRPPVEFLAMVHQRFGILESQSNFFNASLYRLGSSSEAPGLMLYPVHATDSAMHFTADREFGLTHEIPAAELATRPYDLVYASVDLTIADTTGEALLVAELLRDGQPYAWTGRQLEAFVCDPSDTATAWIGVYTPDVFKHTTGTFTWKLYVWNRGLVFDVHSMKAGSIPGNPYTYALLEDFRPLLSPIDR